MGHGRRAGSLRRRTGHGCDVCRQPPSQAPGRLRVGGSLSDCARDSERRHAGPAPGPAALGHHESQPVPKLDSESVPVKPIIELENLMMSSCKMKCSHLKSTHWQRMLSLVLSLSVPTFEDLLNFN